ncbi:MAG: RDD family protein [Acidimicrobiales bacterium]
MADTSQGEGWWQASDDRWYRPEDHPSYLKPPPSQMVPPPGPPTFVQPPGDAAQFAPTPLTPGVSRNYASFGARLGALIIDGLILGIPLGILNAIVTASVPTEITGCTINGRAGLCESPTAGGAAIILLVVLAGFAFQVFFWWGKLVGGTGQTPGRMATNIRVVDLRTGQPIGAGRAIGRGFFSFISAFMLLLGYFWMLWDNNNQTLHDKVVNSVVVRDRP